MRHEHVDGTPAEFEPPPAIGQSSLCQLVQWRAKSSDDRRQ